MHPKPNPIAEIILDVEKRYSTYVMKDFLDRTREDDYTKLHQEICKLEREISATSPANIQESYYLNIKFLALFTALTLSFHHDNYITQVAHIPILTRIIEKLRIMNEQDTSLEPFTNFVSNSKMFKNVLLQAISILRSGLLETDLYLTEKITNFLDIVATIVPFFDLSEEFRKDYNPNITVVDKNAHLLLSTNSSWGNCLKALNPNGTFFKAISKHPDKSEILESIKDTVLNKMFTDPQSPVYYKGRPDQLKNALKLSEEQMLGLHYLTSDKAKIARAIIKTRDKFYMQEVLNGKFTLWPPFLAKPNLLRFFFSTDYTLMLMIRNAIKYLDEHPSDARKLPIPLSSDPRLALLMGLHPRCGRDSSLSLLSPLLLSELISQIFPKTDEIPTIRVPQPK